jgi:hypothetical protein
MNDLAADSLPLKTKNLFFYGFVRYSTIFDEIFRMGFCYMFDRYSDKWLLFGDEKYNYCKKEREVTPPSGIHVYRADESVDYFPNSRNRFPRRLAERVVRNLRDAGY